LCSSSTLNALVPNSARLKENIQIAEDGTSFAANEIEEGMIENAVESPPPIHVVREAPAGPTAMDMKHQLFFEDEEDAKPARLEVEPAKV